MRPHRFTIGGCASMLLDVPLVQLAEQVVCQEHYQMQPSTLATDAMNDPDPEARCKLAPIQSKVATLIGGKVAF